MNESEHRCFYKNSPSAVTAFKRVMPSGCRLLSVDLTMLRTTSTARDFGEIYSKHSNQMGDCEHPSSPSCPAFLHIPLTNADTYCLENGSPPDGVGRGMYTREEAYEAGSEAAKTKCAREPKLFVALRFDRSDREPSAS